VADTDLYGTDKEVQNLAERVYLPEQIKQNNKSIANQTASKICLFVMTMPTLVLSDFQSRK